MSARSPLADLRPGVARWVGAVAAGAATLLIAWVGGVPVPRAAALAVAVAVTVLAVRLGDPDATAWPQPVAGRTRPGRHVALGTLRQLEGARSADVGDRAALQRRLARLERTGPHPAADEVRAAVGLAGRRTSRSSPDRSTRSAPHHDPRSRP